MRSILLFPLVARCLDTINVCIWRMSVVMTVVVGVLAMCCMWSMWGRDSILVFGLMFMESMVLFICSASCVLYSAGSCVRRCMLFCLD